MYNPDIKQTLRMDLANTFDVMAQAFCAKFSPDGKYLAVGVWVKGSRTYIYDVEKGSIVWSRQTRNISRGQEETRRHR